MLVTALRPAAALACTSTCSSAWRAFSDHSKSPYNNDSTETIDFGFQQVPREQKQEMVGQVFSSVAQSYDLMNDLMSGGIHRLWKDRLVESLNPAPHLQHIDVAGGTGDVAFRVVRAMRAAAAAARNQPPAPQYQAPGHQHQQQRHRQQQEESPSTSGQQQHQQQHSQQQPGSSQYGSSDPRDSSGWVTVCDINPDMLAVGQQRAAQQGLDACMSFVEGNAEALPFPDASFDSYTIAFGIRNVTDRPAALRDAWWVLRRGGRFMCLEFSQVQVPLLREVYDAYSLNVIPAIGGLVARDAASYQYLVESIRQFPDQDTFAGMLRDAGFKAVSYENLTGGIVAIHSGFKL